MSSLIFMAGAASGSGPVKKEGLSRKVQKERVPDAEVTKMRSKA